MLEFLGLTDEAIKVIIGCGIMGAALGSQLGALSAYNRATRDQVTKGKIAYLVICILIGGIGFLYGILPGILLFFTFQWAAILGAIFQGCIIGLGAFYITRAIVLNYRRRKYMKNPVVLEAVEFCKKNNVVGIQCFSEGLRFFTKLEDPRYCRPSYSSPIKGDIIAVSYKAEWEKPEASEAYDNADSHIGTLRFADRDYPNVPELRVFASALAKKLGAYGHAEHYHAVRYDTVRYGGNTKYITHHTDILLHDCLVFNRAALLKRKLEWKKTPPKPKKKKPEPAQKPTTWE